MSVLSKQYTLIDLIKLNIQDGDNYNDVNNCMFAVQHTSVMYGQMFKMAGSYPNMTYKQFEVHFNNVYKNMFLKTA